MMTWEEELEAFRRRTKGSAKAHAAARKSIPFGVNSNYRLTDPYPVYFRKAKGSRLWDVDGNEYIDFNMAFGALVAGHSHPTLVRALRERVANGTIYGYESDEAAALAAHMCRRFRVDRIKLSMTGLDATLFSVRLARAVTGRRKIMKFEGCYHGSHDSLMVSVKPKPEDQGDARRPTPVPASRGLLPELTRSAVIAPFNDIDAVESLVQDHANDLAGIIIEPVAMNMGYVLPKAGFLEGLRKLADEAGAILIFDEVKTCGKFYGGAEDAFGVAPDLKIFGKAIGGGIALAGVGGKETVMDEIVPGKIAHAGTFNANPLSVTAGLVTLTKILTPAGIRHAQRVGDALGKGYEDIVEDRKLDVVMQYKGISGAVHFTRGPVTDWRSFQHVDVGRWWAYATSMQNRGIIASAPGADEQWTTSVAHTKEDVRTHLEAFEEVVETVRRMRETVPLVEAV
jgi:glutamate-1-semialdehyde 2,1-aminomutase